MKKFLCALLCVFSFSAVCQAEFTADDFLPQISQEEIIKAAIDELVQSAYKEKSHVFRIIKDVNNGFIFLSVGMGVYDTETNPAEQIILKNTAYVDAFMDAAREMHFGLNGRTFVENDVPFGLDSHQKKTITTSYDNFVDTITYINSLEAQLRDIIAHFKESGTIIYNSHDDSNGFVYLTLINTPQSRKQIKN